MQFRTVLHCWTWFKYISLYNLFIQSLSLLFRKRKKKKIHKKFFIYFYLFASLNQKKTILFFWILEKWWDVSQNILIFKQRKTTIKIQILLDNMCSYKRKKRSAKFVRRIIYKIGKKKNFFNNYLSAKINLRWAL